MSLLNSPITVGNIEIKNRLVMPPMATAKADQNGNVKKTFVNIILKNQDTDISD